MAFVIFSALSGAIYLINDVLDVERDRLHPKKRVRPIASGELPIPVAWAVATLLIAAGLAFAFVLEPLFGATCLAYVASSTAGSPTNLGQLPKPGSHAPRTLMLQ